MLNGKTAVIYGAGGAIGGAVASAFAREGAHVFLTGRTLSSLDRVASEIATRGGRADIATVDALDERAIEDHLASIGDIDISFNAVGFDEVQGVPLVDLSLEDFELPIRSWSRTVFLTSRAAARRMMKRRAGVILTVNPPNAGTALASGFGVASAAVHSITHTLAAELGPHGVRVVLLQPNALPESAALRASVAKYTASLGASVEEGLAGLARTTLLGRLPTLAELANVAAFIASDAASALTGSVIKVDCGAA